jgi:hypothetical protein
MDGQFCDFPWCDCDGNAEWRREHNLEKPGDPEQDCGEQSCNYCRQVVRPRAASGVRACDGAQAEGGNG